MDLVLERIPEYNETPFYINEGNNWVYNRTLNLSSNVIQLQIWDNQMWKTIQTCELITNNLFQFYFDSTFGSTFDLIPGQYLMRTYFSGNSHYFPTAHSFTLQIEPREITMNARSQFADTWISPGNLLNLTVQYSDNIPIDVRMTDEILGYNAPELPVWLSLSIVPEWPWRDNFTSDLGSCFGEYLYYQDIQPPANLQLHHYTQGLVDRPILYPFFEEDTQTYKWTAPLYYDVSETNAEGIAHFEIEEMYYMIFVICMRKSPTSLLIQYHLYRCMLESSMQINGMLMI